MTLSDDTGSSGERDLVLAEVLDVLRSLMKGQQELTAGQQRMERSLEKLSRETPTGNTILPAGSPAESALADTREAEVAHDYPDLDSPRVSPKTLRTEGDADQAANSDTDSDRSSSLSPVSRLQKKRPTLLSDSQVIQKETTGDRPSGANGLPVWFEGLQMREELQGSEEQLSQEFTRTKSLAVRDQTAAAEQLPISFTSSVNSRAPGGLPWVPNISPSSSLRLFIDVFSMTVLAYDMWSVPYLVAFDNKSAVLDWLAYASLTYWTCDVVLNFKTGFYENGELEMRTGPIARHYLKGAFGMDCSLIVVDLVVILAMQLRQAAFGETNNLKLMRIFKVPRLLRLAGVFRLRRLRPIIEKVMAHQASKTMRVLFFLIELCGFIAMFVWLNHILACIWIFIADGIDGASDTGVSWLNQKTGDREYGEYDNDYIYSTALHWAMTQMTPGSMQVFPQNSTERWYNCLCLVAGLVIFSTVISAISARVTSFRIQMQSTRTKMEQLTGFLERAGVRAEVRVPVCKQVEMRLHETKPLSVNELNVIGMLSLSLRNTLQLELCAPHLLEHPYLAFVAEADHTLWREICMTCVDFSMLMRKDTLFIKDSHAVGMHFVTLGKLSYSMALASAPSPDNDFVEAEHGKSLFEVETGKSLSEAALWCRWRHVGTAEVVTTPHCEVLSLNADKLVKALTRDSLVRQVTWAYAKSFFTFLTSCVPLVSPPNDLTIPFGVDEVIASMPKSATILCAQVAIKILKHRPETLLSSWISSVREDNTIQLINEVNEGGSALLATRSQGVVRCVPLLLIRLTRSDQKILVRLRLISKADGSPEATCKLPGGRQEAGEHPDDCLRRLLRGKLRPLDHGVHVEGVEKHITNEHSSKFGVPTRYVRTVINADFKDVADAALREFLIEETKRRKPQVANVVRDEQGPKPTPPRSASSAGGAKPTLIRSASGVQAMTMRGGDLADDYVPADVYSFPGGDVYAWLTLDEYAHFDSDRGQRSLLHWLSFLGMDELPCAARKTGSI